MSDHWSPEDDYVPSPTRRRSLDEILLDLVNRYEAEGRELLRIEHRLARRIFGVGIIVGFGAGMLAGLLGACPR